MKEAMMTAAIKTGTALLRHWASGVEQRRTAPPIETIPTARRSGGVRACLVLAVSGAVFAVLALRRR